MFNQKKEIAPNPLSSGVIYLQFADSRVPSPGGIGGFKYCPINRATTRRLNHLPGLDKL
ncbi:MAG: hypothetical protein NT056_06990 [Proteobacteria bacterium]|nr:hypothetical protein [Pseudomonadota bacterium]